MGFTGQQMERKSRELYEVLCMICSGDALLKVQAVESADGVKAWHVLNKQYSNNTIAGTLRKILQVVAAPKLEIHQVSRGVTNWEANVKEYERTNKTQLPDMVKMVVLVNMMPKEVQDIIFTNAENLKNTNQVREKIMAWVDNRTAMMETPCTWI